MSLDRRVLETSHKGAAFPRMKAKVIITPKAEVLDPQGKTVQGALEQMGCEGVRDVRIGKYIEIEMTATVRLLRRVLMNMPTNFLPTQILRIIGLSLRTDEFCRSPVSRVKLRSGLRTCASKCDGASHTAFVAQGG